MVWFIPEGLYYLANEQNLSSAEEYFKKNTNT